MKEYAIRLAKLILGCFLFGTGLYFGIQANIGLAPWDAFSMGIANKINALYGTVSVWTSVVIIVIDALCREKIGFGTIINGILVGKVVDFWNWMNPFEMLDNFPAGVVLLLVGQATICIGSYFYIGAGLGCGPRDSLMMILTRIFDKLPVGVIRGALEGTVLLIGWFLGAKVGVGTVIAVFGIGTLMEYIFRALEFDVKAVKHEDVFDTVRNVKAIFNK